MEFWPIAFPSVVTFSYRHHLLGSFIFQILPFISLSRHQVIACAFRTCSKSWVKVAPRYPSGPLSFP